MAKKKPVVNKRPPKPQLRVTKNGIETLPPAEELEPIRFNNKKFVRVAETESEETFKEIGERVSRKELKWIYYAVDNNVGTHYYVILNPKK